MASWVRPCSLSNAVILDGEFLPSPRLRLVCGARRRGAGPLSGGGGLVFVIPGHVTQGNQAIAPGIGDGRSIARSITFNRRQP